MTILLFGVSNVGKTTIGENLAQRLGYLFYDLDEEVKNHYDTTLGEFMEMKQMGNEEYMKNSLQSNFL